MRSKKNYVNLDGTSTIKSSFLSCEKDTETIIKKLFVDSYPYSNELKRLLLINTKDCLDDRTNQTYLDKINNTSIANLLDKEYIRLTPKFNLEENEEVKSYIRISFGNFTPNGGNEHYRDCIVEIDVLCHTDYWDLGNYRLRPYKIAGYIDGILNKAKLSGIGTLNFMTADEMNLSPDISGVCLMYSAIHGDDDSIPSEE